MTTTKISFANLVLSSGSFARGGSAHSLVEGSYFGIDVIVKLVEAGEDGNTKALDLAEEAKLQSLCSCHNGILPLLAFNVDDPTIGPMSLIMPRMTTSLFDLIHKQIIPKGFISGSDCHGLYEGRRLSLQRRIMMLHELASALCYLHGHCNVLHGDVKSANMLLDAHGSVKLSDFGLSRHVTTILNATDEVMTASLPWIAPECALGETVSDSTKAEGNEVDRNALHVHSVFARDVYSFSVVIFEVVTGELPYKDMRPQAIMRFLSRGKRLKLPLEGSDGDDIVTQVPLLPGAHRFVPIKRGSDEDLLAHLRVLYAACSAQDPTHRPRFFPWSGAAEEYGQQDKPILEVTKSIVDISSAMKQVSAAPKTLSTVPFVPPSLSPPTPPPPTAPTSAIQSSQGNPSLPPPPQPGASSSSSVPQNIPRQQVPQWRRLSWWSSAGKQALAAGTENASTFISATAAFWGSTDDAIGQQHSRQRGIQRRRWSSGVVDGSTSSSYPIVSNGVKGRNAVVQRSTPNKAFCELSDAETQLAIALLQAERKKEKDDLDSTKSKVTASDGASSSAPSEESFRRLSSHFGTEKE